MDDHRGNARARATQTSPTPREAVAQLMYILHTFGTASDKLWLNATKLLSGEFYFVRINNVETVLGCIQPLAVLCNAVRCM